ncbi:hypothetical protein [Psychrobacter sp. FME5]|uniref:hypothetical protein n=1 Tax=Psychrobacter sp. FME5 TaxID=2487706 RepID=UPI00178856CD|nr:hypothetical protein [Psychrobacter sp. FME5]MBE0444932.1 hypothetical protein [Psychrobacter sp. FME5]MDN5802553.1 hypothetical protein [Psychrobacter sp.]MDN5891054.1 hypothetical protein [Psychrobacter sp.]MDN5897713.1 hypothetical protein [Psychrobacter sp.]
MELKLDIKSNALDSFNEALAKFESGQQGNPTAFKFSILHLSHCLELVLKMYVQTLDEDLVYSKCYKHLVKKAKEDSVDLLAAHVSLVASGFDFSTLLVGQTNPYTITVDQALSIVINETCSSTGNKFVDDQFITDITDMKDLRNSIEHYEFEFTVKEVRLCIGRLVRGLDEFTDIFSLFSLENEVGKDRFSVFSVLVDEYEHAVSEAHHDVTEAKNALFRGVRPKHTMFIEWNVYYCESCHYDTLIPNEDSLTGYRCTYCENEESGEIEKDCDICGSPWANREMSYWGEDVGNVCPRCVNPEAY